MWILSGHETKQTLRHSRSELESLVLERTAELQALSQRLLRVQDEERRRLARDLHDSTGQTLTALKICVDLLQRKLDKDKQTYVEISGIARLVDEALREIRVTSYLLHPPMLDEAGFASAAQWYITGFSRRSGMKVRIDFSPEVTRMPETIEIALFRVLQESLTNAHRHSGTSEVEVRFRQDKQTAILEVRDFGRGMPKEWLSRLGPPAQDSGVGLAGMRERLNELRGGLALEAADPGVRLRVVIPVVTELPELAMNGPVTMKFSLAGATQPALGDALQM
jgi:two-component system NarL family sensor kinase